MHLWNPLLSNPIINVSMLAWFLAQTLKVIIVLITERRLNFSRFVGAGGMPSSHASTVSALTVAVWRLYGGQSVEFAICVVISLIVVYDAAGVRRAAGQQAAILNKMMEHLDDPEFVGTKLKELLGHTPLQVFFGVLLGAAVALIYSF